MNCQNPILFIIFNRPDTTKIVFEQIRNARPPKLYIAADGPRTNRPGEYQKTNEARSIISTIDWDCEVFSLFRDENLGCKLAVSSAIDWFFQNELQGIILEDDCVPEPSFFKFCDLLLDQYAHDARVAQICGSNFATFPEVKGSYCFSKYADIWGWATWRRAWNMYDLNMSDWPEWRDNGGLSRLSGSTIGFRDWWTKIFDQTYDGLIDTWDYQWMYTCWKNQLVSIIPATTQVRNIGFDSDATHTKGGVPDFVTQPTPLEFPLRHPVHITLDPKFERKFATNRYYIDYLTEISTIINRVPFIGHFVTSFFKRAFNLIRYR